LSPSDRLPLSLDQLNAASESEFVQLLEGIYEHSPWVAAHAALERPFPSVPALRNGLIQAVRRADRDRKLALLRAHPELAGKAMVAGTLTAESTGEQSRAGLTHCSPDEFKRLHDLNQAYNERFGFPFILAVRGPRGAGLTRAEIIRTFERRLAHLPAHEFDEALRNVHRIAEIRLAERFAEEPEAGHRILDWADDLARFSDPGFAERGELTVTYLTDAHRRCAAWLAEQMRAVGFDEVSIDAVGNVVGRYAPHPSAGARASWLMTGSHYDTVRNGGRYDGRLGILVPMQAVDRLRRAGRRLPFGIELVAFAEEEGQRFKATFLGSGALTGDFDPAWLDQRDADGVRMGDLMRDAGLPGSLDAIAALRRQPDQYLGFVEVHIEQGPVLSSLDLPLGIVTSINGSVRYLCEMIGRASHAGTTPMGQRRDALTAVAEWALAVERIAASSSETVATIGLCEVPGGSINVVPGRCRFSLDVRATTDPARDDCLSRVMAELESIKLRRGVECRVERVMQVAAAPSDPAWQQRWERAVSRLGLPVHRMPSGAGHDAMKLHDIMPQAMLFVRGLNDGISHNPLEAITNHDAALVQQAFDALIDDLAEHPPGSGL
jgi:N-carbamoyl-L-amino-acid hydrolase